MQEKSTGANARLARVVWPGKLTNEAKVDVIAFVLDEQRSIKDVACILGIVEHTFGNLARQTRSIAVRAGKTGDEPS